MRTPHQRSWPNYLKVKKQLEKILTIHVSLLKSESKILSCDKVTQDWSSAVVATLLVLDFLAGGFFFLVEGAFFPGGFTVVAFLVAFAAVFRFLGAINQHRRSHRKDQVKNRKTKVHTHRWWADRENTPNTPNTCRQTKPTDLHVTIWGIA